MLFGWYWKTKSKMCSCNNIEVMHLVGQEENIHIKIRQKTLQNKEKVRIICRKFISEALFLGSRHPSIYSYLNFSQVRLLCKEQKVWNMNDLSELFIRNDSIFIIISKLNGSQSTKNQSCHPRIIHAYHLRGKDPSYSDEKETYSFSSVRKSDDPIKL